MLRLVKASFILSLAAAATSSGGKAPSISLDDIEGTKSARLMKNKEDIDVQSTFHEDDIKGTGDVPDELAARLVKNRGPITAKITASGSHSRYCDEQDNHNDCTVQFSLVAWKFAGDTGTVHGEYQEKFEDGEVMKVDVDCMVRKGTNEAIVGGSVKAGAPKRHPAGKSMSRRAYVKVVEDGSEKGDFVSSVIFDDDINSHCSNPGMDDKFDVNHELNVVEPRVSVCSKHGDWEQCLEKAKVEQAIE